MDIAIKALQLILALVILVTIHEFGHYIFARIFGIKVNRFYLFFNPKFSLLRYNPMTGKLEVIAWNKEDGSPKAVATFTVNKPHQARSDGKPTWRDTIYGLGWLPLGGYCDIAGMVDETKSAEDLEAVPQDWEFRTKAPWKRLCVMVAGVVFNFLLAVGIYIGIAWHWGDDVIPFQNMTEGLDFAPELQEAGFQNGDILTQLNGQTIDATDYSALWELIQPGTVVGLIRDNEAMSITIPDSLISSLISKGQDFTPMQIRIPAIVARTMNGEGAALAGLEAHDRILKIGNDTVPTLTEFFPVLDSHKGETMPMLIQNSEGATRTVDVQINDNGKIGIQLLSPTEIFERQTIHYSFLESIPRGWQIGIDRLVSYVQSMKQVFTKEGAQSLGGFGTLGDLFPSQWDWYSFWQITAFLSVILAFMNIIPIPGLDGGHTLFLLVEMVTRRKPSDKFLEIVNTCGFVLLLLLLLYANGNDIYRYLLK